MKRNNQKQISLKINFVLLGGFISIALLTSITFLFIERESLGQLFVVYALVLGLCFLFIMYFFLAKLYIPFLKLYKTVMDLRSEFAELDGEIIDTDNRGTIDDEINSLVKKLRSVSKREYLESILKKQAQLDSLQSQINPHFLYNILDSIRGDVLTKGLNETAEMIEALSNYYRYCISSSFNLISFEEEFENVKNYMRIQQYRFGYRINLVKMFDSKDPRIMQFKLPKMTLQPLVENAINHGLEESSKKGKIVIRAMCTDRRIMITVEDNGDGMSITQLNAINVKLQGAGVTSDDINAKGTGVALINVSQRIKLLYGEEYGLYLNSAEGLGTEVHVYLPLKEGEQLE